MRPFVPAGKYPHRCFNVHPDGGLYLGDKKGARKRRCQKRMSFTLRREPPACPQCGSSEHWRRETKHRKKDRARENCYSTACPYAWAGPHSIYSDECVNNPKAEELREQREWDAIGEELGAVKGATTNDDEVPF